MRVDFKCKVKYDFDTNFNQYIRLDVKYRMEGKLFYTDLDKTVFSADKFQIANQNDGTRLEDYVDYLYDKLTTVEGRNELRNKITQKIKEEIQEKHKDEVSYQNIHNKAKEMKKMVSDSSYLNGSFEI